MGDAMSEVRIGQVWKDRYCIPDRYVRVERQVKFMNGLTYVRVRICNESGYVSLSAKRRPILSVRFPKFYDLHRDFIHGALTAPLPARKLTKSYNPARTRREAFGPDPQVPVPKVRR